MNTIPNIFLNALLADAAYADNLINGKEGDPTPGVRVKLFFT